MNRCYEMSFFFYCWTWEKNPRANTWIPRNRAWNACSSRNLQFSSLNPTFRSQILAISLPDMYLTARKQGISSDFPTADEPTKCEHVAERSRICTATSHLPLSDIVKLQHIYGISGDGKETELSSSSIIYKFRVWERKTKSKCHKYDNTVKKS